MLMLSAGMVAAEKQTGSDKSTGGTDVRPETTSAQGTASRSNDSQQGDGSAEPKLISTEQQTQNQGEDTMLTAQQKQQTKAGNVQELQ